LFPPFDSSFGLFNPQLSSIVLALQFLLPQLRTACSLPAKLIVTMAGSTTGEPNDEIVPTENLNGSAQPTPEVNENKEVKDVKDGKAPAEKAPKLACRGKKHDMKKRKPKKKNDESDSSSSSSSPHESDADSDESSSSESESDSEKRKRHRLRTKARSKRALKDKKRLRKKKQRSRKVETSDSSTDTSEVSEDEASAESDESLDDRALRKLITRLKLKKRANELTASDPVVDRSREKRPKKKKPASKVAYKRVDQCELNQVTDHISILTSIS
jgi:hypothetical protein